MFEGGIELVGLGWQEGLTFTAGVGAAQGSMEASSHHTLGLFTFLLEIWTRGHCTHCETTDFSLRTVKVCFPQTVVVQQLRG